MQNLFLDRGRHFGDLGVPLLLLGGPAYPVLPWLMKPVMEILENACKPHRMYRVHLRI